VKWLADENLHYDIVRGILRRAPDFDIVRAQDLPQVSGQDDLALLDWAAQAGRISHAGRVNYDPGVAGTAKTTFPMRRDRASAGFAPH